MLARRDCLKPHELSLQPSNRANDVFLRYIKVRKISFLSCKVHDFEFMTVPGFERNQYYGILTFYFPCSIWHQYACMRIPCSSTLSDEPAVLRSIIARILHSSCQKCSSLFVKSFVALFVKLYRHDGTFLRFMLPDMSCRGHFLVTIYINRLSYFSIGCSELLLSFVTIMYC